MIEIKCKNCNGNDLVLRGGFYVCQNCGSKYVPETTDNLPNMDKLRKKMLKKFDKGDYYEARELSDKILEVDDSDAMAWVIRGGCALASGLDSYTTGVVVKSFENAIGCVTDEDAYEVQHFIKMQTSFYWEKMCALDKTLEERIVKLTNIDEFTTPSAMLLST